MLRLKQSGLAEFILSFTHRREWFVWRDVEPAGTREVRRGSCGAWWCRERSFDNTVVRPVVTQETVDNTSSTGGRGDRDLVPVCSSTRVHVV